jgi:hypothetical protein
MRGEPLASVLTGPLDARVRDQIIADTNGNPLALLELPRELTPAQPAGGSGSAARYRWTGRSRRADTRMCRHRPGATQQPWRRHRLLRHGDTGNAALRSPGQA